MIIHRKGRNPGWWIGKMMDCAKCQCRFQLEDGDAKIVKEIGPPIYIYCPCPECNAECRLDFVPGK